MAPSELDVDNFKKIFLVNLILFLPLLALLSWPYYFSSRLLSLSPFIQYGGGLLFGLPFTFTVLHGIVTVSVGSVQRSYYYEWLRSHPYSYGLLFHPALTSTRLRLTLFAASMVLLISGAIFS